MRALPLELYAVLLVIFGAAVCWGLLSPVERLPLWSRTHDKLLHGVAFAILAILASLSLPDTRSGVLWISLVTAGLAGEIAQHMTPHRQFCWRDAVANAVGATVGLVGYQWVFDRGV